jgi:hypothetical protein
MGEWNRNSIGTLACDRCRFVNIVAQHIGIAFFSKIVIGVIWAKHAVVIFLFWLKGEVKYHAPPDAATR